MISYHPVIQSYMKHPPINLRVLSQSRYLDPHLVHKYPWWPWNWGYLSENPIIPAWLVLALPNKPWDYISLAQLPCSYILHRRIPNRFIYGIHRMSPFEWLSTLDNSTKSVYESYIYRQYAIRIANEVYRRVIIPKRHRRWVKIVGKIVPKHRYCMNVVRNIASYL